MSFIKIKLFNLVIIKFCDSLLESQKSCARPGKMSNNKSTIVLLFAPDTSGMQTLPDEPSSRNPWMMATSLSMSLPIEDEEMHFLILNN